MKLLNSGVLLISVCVALITAATYSLYREMTVRIEKNSADSIGTIIFKKKYAERKYSEYVIWENIADNSPVYNFDSVRTFDGSAAIIRLNNGAEIALEEDSMIVLSIDEKGVKIDFDRGSLSVNNAKGSDSISLTTEDTKLSMNNGELALTKQEGSVDVNVSSGEITIDSGGETSKIDNNSSAQITNGKTEIKNISIIPDSPSNNAFFVTFNNSAAIFLSWNSDSQQEQTVEIAKDNDFTATVYTYKTAGRSCSTEISPGEYYWRISSEGEYSPVRKFTLLKDTVPELIFPKEGETVSVTGDDEPVNFKWSGSEYSSSYKFELSRNQNLSSPLETMDVQLNSASVSNLPSGDIWYRVSRNYPGSFVLLDINSAAVRFTLNRITFTKTRPKVLHEKEMSASTLTENIVFNWESCKGANDYTVDIAKDSDFKNLIKSSSAGLTFYNTGKLSEGTYYWRVFANYGKGDSLVSETIALSVSPPKPVVYVSPENGSIISDNPDSVTFAWKDPQQIENYLLETSTDPDFNRIISSEKSRYTNYNQKNPGPGRYYWRVSILGRTGDTAVKGETYSFVIPEVLQKPSAISPSNMGVIDLDTADSINFRWNNVSGADMYEIEIFQRVSGNDRPITVLTTAETSMEIKDFLQFEPGTIVWIVRAKKTDNNRISATSESARNYFELKVNENIAAPTPNVPDTIYVR